MTRAADEEIVESEHPLTIVEIYLGQRDFALTVFAVEHAADSASSIFNLKWQEHAIVPRRVGIHGHNRQVADILGRVGHETILANDYDQHAAAEIKVRQKAAINRFDGQTEV